MSIQSESGKTVMSEREPFINTNNLSHKVTAVVASVMCSLMLGCAQAEAPASKSQALKVGEPQSLLIQGYNYTDDYIDSFTVNGQGGGNVFVSGPASGGGKSVCCMTYRPGTPLPIKLKVRWVSGYCIERVKNPYPYGKPYHDQRRHLWREADAHASDLSNGRPRALEVHIYPDNHVEAAITEGDSEPRVSLPRTANYERLGVTHNYPNCTNDQLQQSEQ
jgi:hypothetical protein